MTHFTLLIALIFCLSTDAASCHAQDESSGAVAYVDGHLAGKLPGVSKAIFAAGDFNTGKGWQRNVHLWCADLDLTCFSPWNSTEHNLQGGTLITCRHILLANHFSNPYTGTPPMIPGLTTIEFVANDNTVYTRTIKRLNQVAGTDLLIGTLDSDLPPKIVPAQIFPSDQGTGVAPGTPLIYTGQDKWASVGECVGGSGPTVTLRSAVAAGRAAWTTAGPARVGDSGSPIFLPVHGRAVLLCHFFFPNGGPSTGFYTAGINAITGPEYPVTEASLPSTAGPEVVRAAASDKAKLRIKRWSMGSGEPASATR